MVVAAAAAAALCPSAALAAAGLEVGIEDERLLLDDPVAAPAAVAAWRDLGVEVVRVHARWNRLAPRPTARRRPGGFDAADPGDPRYDWTELDRAVALLRGAGLRVALTLTGPGPLWASRRPSLGDPRYKPDPRAYRAFAAAVARRYRGLIERYLLWNEPNLPGWLSPQHACSRPGRCTPVAPHLYRDLVRAAVPVLRAADPEAEIAIGELAPVGYRPRSNLTATPPLAFLRAFGCVDRRFRPLRDGACRGFRPASADALGHHGHGIRQAPDQPSRERDWAKLGDLPQLERTLDRLTRRGRIRAPNRRLDVHITEFGHQTSPPDHATGITLERQASWLQQASYIAWRDPRVRSITFYQWHDEPVRYRGPGDLAYAGWQSGLHFVDGSPKPALAGFVAPLVLDRRGGGFVRAWGQVRPGGRHVVTLEQQSDGGPFVALESIPTDERGYWALTIPAARGDGLRVSWRPPDAAGTVRYSGTAVVGGEGGRLSAGR